VSGATFLREFLKDPVMLGAVAPSGPELARTVVEAADLRPGQLVVELGAGTGPMTAEILRQRPEGPFVALEPNPQLAAALRARFPQVRVEERFAHELPAILAVMDPERRADRVVSSLPWAIWSPERQEEALGAVLAILAPAGRMVTFAYLHSQALPAARRFRAALEARFSRVSTTRTAWRNLPPAFAFVCER
jgi:phospholipid N-methyltransferase